MRQNLRSAGFECRQKSNDHSPTLPSWIRNKLCFFLKKISKGRQLVPQTVAMQKITCKAAMPGRRRRSNHYRLCDHSDVALQHVFGPDASIQLSITSPRKERNIILKKIFVYTIYYAWVYMHKQSSEVMLDVNVCFLNCFLARRAFRVKKKWAKYEGSRKREKIIKNYLWFFMLQVFNQPGQLFNCVVGWIGLGIHTHLE